MKKPDISAELALEWLNFVQGEWRDHVFFPRNAPVFRPAAHLRLAAQDDLINAILYDFACVRSFLKPKIHSRYRGEVASFAVWIKASERKNVASDRKREKRETSLGEHRAAQTESNQLHQGTSRTRTPKDVRGEAHQAPRRQPRRT